MTGFAETYHSYGDGQQNVGQPPDAIITKGFIPEVAGARGQPLVAQWLNWIFRKLFRLANRDVVSDETGTTLYTVADSFITLYAYDRANPTRYIHAIGYKGALDAVHSLTIISSNTLTLGTGTAGGNQPVSGGSDVITLGMSRQFGDI